MRALSLTPAQMQRGRTNWFQRWDKHQRRFLAVDAETLVFQMYTRHGYALMGKRGWGHRFEPA